MPARRRALSSDLTAWGSTVAALTIVDGSGPKAGGFSLSERLLVGIRRPGSNLTHPNVVSVPTQRIPRDLYLSLIGSMELIRNSDTEYFFRFPEVTERNQNGHHPVNFVIETVLSRKLGAAELLETDVIRYASAFFSITLGKAEYKTENPYGTEEKIAMGNLWVLITSGFARFPSSTASFSRVFPVTLKALAKAKRAGLPLAGFPADLDPAKHPVGGLCIASTITSTDFLAAGPHA
ncbi:MAG: hypothetical protein NTX64_02905 [Elusimicrobia bacterium]|nr:hypothetical protein [Elusimicrobiota bacterium]